MRVGFTASAFDLLHAGHVSMLREAKSHCDYLICGLQVDPSVDRAWKAKPVQSVVERYVQLAAVAYVDEIIPYCTEADLEDILRLHRIHVRFLGEEYRDADFTGKALGEQLGIEIHFNKRHHAFSSSSLRARAASAARSS